MTPSHSAIDHESDINCLEKERQATDESCRIKAPSHTHTHTHGKRRQITLMHHERAADQLSKMPINLSCVKLP